jgi:hypothetical protein
MRQPEFIVNQPEGDNSWRSLDYDLHSSDLVERPNVLLFGQNHLVSADGNWSCETQSFKLQYLEALTHPSYGEIFPGQKPLVDVREGKALLSLEKFDTSTIQHISAPVFLATPLEPDNWGRWMVTVVTKVFWYRRFGQGRRFLCRSGKPWQMGVLNHLGISPDEILPHEPGRVYFCNDLMTINYSVTNMTISEIEKGIFQDIAAASIRGNSADAGERIFLSRLSHSRKNPNYRVLQNESELLRRVSQLGFTVIEPETLSFEQQICVFAKASFVVGLGGAGMFNVVFCKPGTRVLTIEATTTFMRAHSCLFSSCGHRYAVIFGSPDQSDCTPVHKRWSVSVDEVCSAIGRMSSI